MNATTTTARTVPDARIRPTPLPAGGRTAEAARLGVTSPAMIVRSVGSAPRTGIVRSEVIVPRPVIDLRVATVLPTGIARSGRIVRRTAIDRSGRTVRPGIARSCRTVRHMVIAPSGRTVRLVIDLSAAIVRPTATARSVVTGRRTATVLSAMTAPPLDVPGETTVVGPGGRAAPTGMGVTRSVHVIARPPRIATLSASSRCVLPRRSPTCPTTSSPAISTRSPVAS